MSLSKNITGGLRRRTSLLRARFVPVIVIMVIMVMLAVSILTAPSASAAPTDTNVEDQKTGDPIIMLIILALAVLCFVGYFYMEETILVYLGAFFVVLAVVIYYVRI